MGGVRSLGPQRAPHHALKFTMMLYTRSRNSYMQMLMGLSALLSTILPPCEEVGIHLTAYILHRASCMSARLCHLEEVGIHARSRHRGTRPRPLHDERLRGIPLCRERADVVRVLRAYEVEGKWWV